MRLSSTSARDSARRRFLRTFFHDLATPLSAVSLHLEGANRRLVRGEDPAGSLDIARSELGRAFDLFERGRELLLSEPADVESFGFDEWVEATLARFARDGVEVHGATGGRISGDREKLSEALLSLLQNAIEHGSSPPVAVFRERAGVRIQVRIENRGVLPAEDPEKLFAPRSAAAGKNWGMGLALARLYAADAGGDILLSQNGENVAAILTFPEEPA
ncbi:MAG TPA: HAMP domain-containing sensor histidine kinase [Thermoanaerobaculia bacterium]|nr:HAMP domain-containing sensor histidine kinase [Thermoanaerobaculia bacterium]